MAMDMTFAYIEGNFMPTKVGQQVVETNTFIVYLFCGINPWANFKNFSKNRNFNCCYVLSLPT